MSNSCPLSGRRGVPWRWLWIGGKSCDGYTYCISQANTLPIPPPVYAGSTLSCAHRHTSVMLYSTHETTNQP